MKRVLGMGNALVDILVRINDDRELGKLKKGTMTLVDHMQMHDVMLAIQAQDVQRSAGGSAANTINGLATLGQSVAFIGKVGDDEAGAFFRTDMEGRHVRTHLLRGKAQTGRCMVLISPDHERTFATHLGSAVELEAADLAEEMFKDCAVFHVEGYLVQNHALLESAFRLARDCGCMVSLDLASHNTVNDNLEFLRRMTREYVDVVFANEDEARVFTGESDPRKAAEALNRSAELAVVKVGPNGSLVSDRSGLIHVDAAPARVVDTTGAGDLYAAGFLYARLKDHDLRTCACIGSLLGSRVVEVVGAKMGTEKWAEIQKEVADIENGRTPSWM